jgi:hypothetical protein
LSLVCRLRMRPGRSVSPLAANMGSSPSFVRRCCLRTDLIIVSRCTLVKEPILPSGMHKNDLLQENSVMHMAFKHAFCSAKPRSRHCGEDE